MTPMYSRQTLLEEGARIAQEPPQATYVGYVSTVEGVFSELRFRGDDGFEFEALILLPHIDILPKVGSKHRIREKVRHFKGFPTLRYYVLE